MMSAAAVAAALMAFLVMMLPVMVALDVGVIGKITGQEGLDRSVRVAGNAAEQLNTNRSKGHLSTAADSSADQNIGLQSIQDLSQSAVTAAICADNLRRNDLAVFHIINLKGFGMAEMLEDIAVFISDCDSHNIISFKKIVVFCKLLPNAGFIAAGTVLRITYTEGASFDSQRAALNQNLGQLQSGVFIYFLCGGSGNLHPFTALFLRKSQVINQANGFVLIYS